jgi:DNA-directed RNA polymerase specialized sigma24 family protein
MRASTQPGIEDLYRDHALGLVRFALLLTGDRAAAEDVVQDAFLGLHRHWEEIRDPGNVLAYLRTAVVNGSRSRHRRHLVARRLRPEPLALAQSAGDRRDSPHQQGGRGIDRLPRADRTGPSAPGGIMTSAEDRLRDAYRAVTDMVREEELPGLYDKRARTRRRSRFSTFAPLAAAAAVVVAIGVGVAVPRWVSSSSRPAAPTTPAASAIPAGAPPFVVVMNKADGRGSHGPLVVVSAATGRITGKVPEPMPDTSWFDVAVTGSGTTFVLAAAPLRGGLCNPTYLYRLTLAASGAPASLRPWSDPVVRAEIGQITASADGGTLAFLETGCNSPDQEIGIIRGGRMKTWHEPDLLVADSLSLSADGSVLGYAESRMGQGGRVRVLDTSSAPGSATAASKTVYTYPAAGRGGSVVIGPDGTTMFVAWVTGFDIVHLAGYRIGPVGVQSTLFRRVLPTGVSVSWAGSQLLVWDPGVYLVDPVTGKVTRVRAAWTDSWGISW